MKRGRAAAAQPGAGREGVKKGEAEHPGGRATACAGGEGRGDKAWGHAWPKDPGTEAAGLELSSARAQGCRDRA